MWTAGWSSVVWKEVQRAGQMQEVLLGSVFRPSQGMYSFGLTGSHSSLVHWDIRFLTEHSRAGAIVQG